MPTEDHHSSLPIAERKRLLVAQGASYRAGITHARTSMRTSMSAESLAKSAMNHVAMGAMGAVTAFKSGAILKGANLQVILPLAMSVIARLSNKKHLVKPIAGGALVLGAVAAIARFVIKKRSANRMKRR
jgi:hypothetical protein